MRKYTKEQLIFYLKRLASELKRSPTLKDINAKSNFPSGATYSERFGSWNNSLKKADLQINIRKKYDKNELIEAIKQLSKELERSPKTIDLENKNWTASYSTYRKYFGSWKSALKHAGMKEEPYKNLKEFTKKKTKRKY